MSSVVQTVTADDIERLYTHFLSLGAEDRRLRFGLSMRDDAIADYVNRIDFDHDTVLGVYDERLCLVGVAHVAFRGQTSELGLSVLESHRGRSIGTNLFKHAVLTARNRGVLSFFMHCLRENQAMMHIAEKAGMRIILESSEADAYLQLPPRTLFTIGHELYARHMALVDWVLIANMNSRRTNFGLPRSTPTHERRVN